MKITFSAHRIVEETVDVAFPLYLTDATSGRDFSGDYSCLKVRRVDADGTLYMIDRHIEGGHADYRFDSFRIPQEELGEALAELLAGDEDGAPEIGSPEVWTQLLTEMQGMLMAFPSPRPERSN